LSASLHRGGSTWSVRFSARSGQPTTPIVAFLPFVAYQSPAARAGGLYDDGLNFAGDYNSATLPPYLRIDVGWRGSKDVDWFGGGTLTPFASIANLFSLPNVVGVAPEQRRDGVTERVYAPQLPMLPFLGLEFRF